MIKNLPSLFLFDKTSYVEGLMHYHIIVNNVAGSDSQYWLEEMNSLNEEELIFEEDEDYLDDEEDEDMDFDDEDEDGDFSSLFEEDEEDE